MMRILRARRLWYVGGLFEGNTGFRPSGESARNLVVVICALLARSSLWDPCIAGFVQQGGVASCNSGYFGAEAGYN